MTTHAPEAAALYDIPGPVTRKRHRVYGIVSTVLILALVGWIIYLLFATEQFTSAKWSPFEYKGIQELLLRGLGNTLKAFAYAAVLSLALGAVLAVGRLSEHRAVRWLATLVVEFFRAMPVLVMIFFIFVALKVQPLPALVAGLTLYNGSVLAEVFRTGINSVDRGQREAAYALGMRKTQVMTFVLAPQAVRAMLPAIISQLVVALKDTSLGYLITYEEFLHSRQTHRVQPRLRSSLHPRGDGDLADLHRDVHAALLVRQLGGQAGAAQPEDEGRGSRTGRTRNAAAGSAVAQTGRTAVWRSGARPAAAGDHFSRNGTDRYEGSVSGEEKVSCEPMGLCSI